MFSFNFRLLYALANIAAILTITTTFAAAAPQTATVPILSANDPRNMLHLTPDQQRQVIKLDESIRSQAQVIENNKSLSNDVKTNKLLALRSQAITSRLAILTPAQRKSVSAASAARKATQAKYAAQIQILQKELTLQEQELQKSFSPQQKSMNDNFNTQMKALVTQLTNDKTLTDQQKMQKFQDTKTSLTDKMTATLTPSQKAIISKMKSENEEGQALGNLYSLAGR